MKTNPVNRSSVGLIGPSAFQASANCQPARLVFLKSRQAKERLKPYLAPNNVEKTMAAPVTVIVAYDLEFYERLPQLFPHVDARSWFVGHDELIRTTAFRNGSLQGGYLILAARSLGLGLKVHAEPHARTGAARLAVELGAVSADHLEHVGPDDIDILAQSNTIATLLPGWVFHLGLKRGAPARPLIDRGAAIALATGFNLSASPTCNMQMILALACNQMQMTPAEAISASTINGAHALGCAGRVGSIEAGKRADFIIINTDAPHLTPVWNPVATVVFGAQGSDVDTVVVDGQVLMSGRRVQTLDEGAILEDVRRRYHDVARRAGATSIAPLWPVT